MKGTYLRNTRLFLGSENFLNYTVEYLANLICDFDMAWYPFDRQICTIELFQDEDSILVNPVSITYRGLELLQQHYVMKTTFCSKIIDGKSGAIAEVYLGRPLFGNLLTVYIPTGTLVILGHMVRAFEEEFLDMVIGVNVTLLLVLSTL